MKKALFLMLFMGSLFLANAQSAVGVTYQNQTYNDGDTIAVTVPTTVESLATIGLKNQSTSRLEGLVVTLTEVSVGGIEIYAICTDQCVPGLVSNSFDIAIRGSYNTLVFDFFNNYPENTTPSVYTMNVANNDVSTTVVLKLCFEGVGIGQVGTFASLLAFPNPSENHATIYYSTVRPAELVIYDVLGNLRHSQRVDGTGTLSLGLGCGTPTLELGTGIYFYGLLVDETCRVMKKLVIR